MCWSSETSKSEKKEFAGGELFFLKFRLVQTYNDGFDGLSKFMGKHILVLELLERDGVLERRFRRVGGAAAEKFPFGPLTYEDSEVLIL